jgi:cell division protein FtsL
VSLPARRLDTPRPAAPNQRRPALPAQQRGRPAVRRARRGTRRQLGFVLLASALVGSMVFGIVVLNVLLAQASFRIDESERRIEALSEEHLELQREQATLSAPGRIAAWASRHGMRLPDDIRILHAPGKGSADPAGADSNASQTGAAPEPGPDRPT